VIQKPKYDEVLCFQQLNVVLAGDVGDVGLLVLLQPVSFALLQSDAAVDVTAWHM